MSTNHISKDLATRDPIPDEDGELRLLWKRATVSTERWAAVRATFPHLEVLMGQRLSPLTSHPEVNLLEAAILGVKKAEWRMLKHLATNLPVTAEANDSHHPTSSGLAPQEDAAVRMP